MLLLRINTYFCLSVRHLMPYTVPNSILGLILLPRLTESVLLRAINSLQYLSPALGFIKY